MNASDLTDKNLVEKTDSFVEGERRNLLAFLHHLKEIDRRRLYSDYKCSSIYHFMIKRYGYSEKEAYSRVSAMSLLKELPQIEDKIERGELNLTNLNLMQTLFRKEKKSGNEFNAEKKLEALDTIACKSTREVAILREQMSSNPRELNPDKITHLSERKIELTFTANASLQTKIERLRGQRAHKNPNQSLGELFEELLDQALEPAARPKRRIKRITVKTADVKVKESKPTVIEVQNQTHCSICNSTNAIESDHIIPKAKGGSDDEQNRRSLCRSCNQRAAIKHYGQMKMDQYIN